MKKILLLLFLSVSPALADYTEFYVTGTPTNNLNSGSTTSDGPVFHGATGYFTNTTGWWKSSGAVDLSGVSVGMFASIYTNLSTTNVFTALVTSVSDADDTIAVSLVAKAGTAPAADTDGFTQIRVGGAWRGPSTNGVNNYDQGFPFSFVEATLTNANLNPPCVNIKSGTAYGITNTMTHADAGPITFEGYATNPHDGGRAIIDGTLAAASYILITVSGANNMFKNLIFQNNGTSGTADSVNITGTENIFWGVTSSDSYGAGFESSSAASSSLYVECEAMRNNKGNNSANGGFVTAASGTYLRCYAWSNNYAGSVDSAGFKTAETDFQMLNFINCIAFANGRNGFGVGTRQGVLFVGCDSYDNAWEGFQLASGSGVNSMTIINCNTAKNGRRGINTGATRLQFQFNTVGFGTGTMTNGFGNLDVTNIAQVVNMKLYAVDVTPWTDPANQNFTINLTAAKAAGRGNFTQSAVNSPTNTVSYPDLGAAQQASTNAGAAVVTRGMTFAQ